MLGLLIAGIFGNFQQVHARILWSGETIYIRSNGDIDWRPSGASPPPISTPDRVHYDITGDITTTGYGIVVERDNIIINGNGHTIKGPENFVGIYLEGRNNVTVMRTTIREYHSGIGLISSSEISILGNHLIENNYGIFMEVSSNNVISNIRIGVITTAESIIESSHEEAIYIHSSSGNTIKGSIIESNYRGILLSGSDGNIIKYNTLRNNGERGIIVGGSGNTIQGNTITANGAGIDVRSPGNTFLGNTIESNRDYGIRLSSSNSNTIAGNTIRGNGYGIYLTGSNGNNIHENNITNNGNGVYLSSSSGNRFWLNNFTNNNVQVSATMEQNYWNASYPTGGNYWSDCRGTDVKKGPNQDQSGSDGIVDTPYSINPNNIDYLPRGLYFRTPITVPPMTPLLRIKVGISSLGAPATAPPGSSISVPITIHYETLAPTHVLARITSGATEVWSYDFGSKDGTGDLSYTATFNAPSSPGSYTYEIRACYQSAGRWDIMDRKTFQLQVSPPTSQATQTPASTTQVPPQTSSTTQTQSSTPQPQTSSTTQTHPTSTQTTTTQTQSPAPSPSPSQPPSLDLTGLLLIAVVVMALIIAILLLRMRAKPPA